MLMHGWWACAGVTEVEAGWLLEVARPLVALSPPLDAPAPRYDPKQDAVVALHGATFGRHEWALPAAKRPHPDPRVRARAFAAALLGGEVFQELKGAKEVAFLVRLGMWRHPAMTGLVLLGGKVFLSSEVWRRSLCLVRLDACGGVQPNLAGACRPGAGGRAWEGGRGAQPGGAARGGPRSCPAAALRGEQGGACRGLAQRPRLPEAGAHGLDAQGAERQIGVSLKVAGLPSL